MSWESTFFMYWSQFSSHNVGSISDLTSDEYPRICLKELCVFILEIDECAECSRTCEEQCLVQNFPDSAARFPESRSHLLPDVSKCIGWCSSFLRKLPMSKVPTERILSIW